jgi:hypothetical protein
MSDRRRRPRPGPADDDAALLRALRELGADYEPDSGAIERRVHGTARLELVNRNGAREDRYRAPERGRLPALVHHSRPVLLPAAAVLLLIGGVVLVTSSRGQDPVDTVAGPVATSAASTPPPTQSPSPSRSPATALAPKPGETSTTSTSTTSTSRPPKGTGTPNPPGRAATVKVSTAAAAATGIGVDLRRPPLTDWIAVGSRSDLKQVRAKAAAAEPVLTFAQPSSATSVAGPFSTSWTVGLPEETHTAATDWLMTDGESGWTVTVAAGAPRTVVLYAGTSDLRGTVAVTGKGLTAKRALLEPAASAAEPVIITVTLPSTTAVTRIRLSGTADGTAPSAYLAAVTARS